MPEYGTLSYLWYDIKRRAKRRQAPQVTRLLIPSSRKHRLLGILVLLVALKANMAFAEKGGPIRREKKVDTKKNIYSHTNV